MIRSVANVTNGHKRTKSDEGLAASEVVIFYSRRAFNLCSINGPLVANVISCLTRCIISTKTRFSPSRLIFLRGTLVSSRGPSRDRNLRSGCDGASGSSSFLKLEWSTIPKILQSSSDSRDCRFPNLSKNERGHQKSSIVSRILFCHSSYWSMRSSTRFLVLAAHTPEQT